MTTFRNSIQDGMEFYYQWRKSHSMISWKVCTNWGYVSLRNSKPYWNCTTWRFIRRYRFPTIRSGKNHGEEELDHNFRLRNFDARHGRIESGAVVKSRKGWIGVEGGKGICYPWKKVRCAQGDWCSFRHETVRKNQNTLPPHFLSHQCHEVEVCQGKEVSEAKVTMVPFFDNRADIIWRVLARERFVNIGILPSVNSIKMKRVVRLETSVCFRITRLMNDEKPNKKQRRATSQKEEKPMTRMLWLLWKVYHNFVVYHKIQMHSFLKVESLGKTRCRKSWHQFKGYDSLSLRNVKQVSGKRQDHSSSAKSLRFEIWVESQWKHLQAQRKRQGCIPMVSKKDLNSAELEIRRTSRCPTTVMTANGEMQTREEATLFVNQLDLFVKVMLLEETPAVLSLEKLCEDHVYTYHWISCQKPHLIHELPDWFGKLERIWLMKVLQQSLGGTQSREVQTLPSHLMNYQWSTHFPKDPKLWYLLEDENNKGFLQKTCWYSRAQSGTYWWLDYSGSQSSQWRKGTNNHRYAEVVQDLATQWIQ